MARIKWRNKAMRIKPQIRPKTIKIDPKPKPFLPLEIVEIILSKLPFKSLLRFKIVSKSWNAIISQPGFGVPMDYSDLKIGHTDWKALLPPGERKVFWESASMGFWLDIETGKNCFVLGASNVVMKADADYQRHWEIKNDPRSRFPGVAELVNSSELFIRGVIKLQMLSPLTFYAAYLVFKLTETHKNPKSAKAFIRHIHGESESSNIDYSKEQDQIVHFRPGKGRNGQIAYIRNDGWIEVEIGEFYVREGDEGEIETVLFEQNRYMMRGLIIQGIEFRPLWNPVTPVVSKRG